MRKYALELLISGSIAILFSLVLPVLSFTTDINSAHILVCLGGVTAAFLVSLHALWRLAENGHLLTDFSILLKQ